MQTDEACREQLNNHDADAASDMSSSKATHVNRTTFVLSGLQCVPLNFTVQEAHGQGYPGAGSRRNPVQEKQHIKSVCAVT
eukprot:1465364-Amphidinium_carterae.2